MRAMPWTVRGPALSTALLALALGGCLDRGGLNPLPDAAADKDGGAGTGGTRTGGASGTGTGGAGTGGASNTGGASGTGGRGMMGTGGAPASGGRMGTGTGGNTASGGTTPATGGASGTGGKPMCGAICDIYCPYGNVLDASGCPTCKCNPMPNCPQVKCAIDCPNGYLKDEKGCQTCTCNPDPKPCSTDECGAMPPTNTVACPAGTSATPGGDPPGAGAAIVAPYLCTRDAATGKCVWQPVGCRQCPTVACKPCPSGYEIGPDGCSSCVCKPDASSACGSYNTPATCAADTSCKWLQPGCTEPALAAAGCFAKTSLGCTTDASCGAGHQCLKRFVNPCVALNPGDTTCAACAASETICQ